jgi:hypothetical protein
VTFQVADQQIFHDPRHPSRILLPISEESWQALTREEEAAV